MPIAEQMLRIAIASGGFTMVDLKTIAVDELTRQLGNATRAAKRLHITPGTAHGILRRDECQKNHR